MARIDRAFAAACVAAFVCMVIVIGVVMVGDHASPRATDPPPYPHTGPCRGATGDIREACIAAWQLLYAANSDNMRMFCHRRVPARLEHDCDTKLSDAYSPYEFAVNNYRTLSATVLVDGVARVLVVCTTIDDTQARVYVYLDRDSGVLRYAGIGRAPAPPAS